MATYTSVQLPPEARILVVKLATIGDLLLATPALKALRESYPRARIDLLITPSSAGILDDWDVIDQVIVLDKYLFDHPKQLLARPSNLFKLRPLLRALREGNYDAVILMHHLTLFFGRRKHQALMLATGARYLVGLDNGHGWFLNVRVPDRGFGAMHEAEYCLALAEAIGGRTQQKWLTMPLREEHHLQARQLIFGTENASAQAMHPLIAMHPGSGGYSSARRWPPERFAQLANTLYQEVGGQLLLVGGPEERALHTHIMDLLHPDIPALSLAGKSTLQVTAAALELADLFIGNDAGPMHIATAMGTPTVAIFGLSNWQAWGPYTGNKAGQKAIVVKQDLPCMPCFYRGHLLGTPEGCATRDCLTTLDIGPVAAAARRLLHETGKVRTDCPQ